MNILGFFRINLWKIATGGAAVISLILTALLMSTYFENKTIIRQREVLVAQINDPKTGYIAQLSQARSNVQQLEATLTAQNSAYEKLSVESRARLAESQRRLAAAQVQTRQMERRLGQFLATKPQGATLEDRIRDIDARALKEFLP